ncbi:peroxidase family protein [Streptomyces sp. 1222.5]|uniref:peroxidase family protein n=1 Tax=Streptomyces sp. 1222.5 TaxID=1881026 RepID=UPI003D725E5A
MKFRALHRSALLAAAISVVAAMIGPAPAGAAPSDSDGQQAATDFLNGLVLESLDGGGNNPFHPSWGRSGTAYSRVAPAEYADGKGVPKPGPNSRYISNRVFNDVHQNVFSERGVTQWGFTWGQFIDHNIGLRAEGDESAAIAFNSSDPLESFTNDFGSIAFHRSKAAEGTTVRQQFNTVGSYIDMSSVYGDNTSRLEWLRTGAVDDDMSNNGAQLLLPGGLLPTRTARGDASKAPAMDVEGQLRAHPERAAVAGDVRANENIALTATQTLFAREHNRIAAQLPAYLSNETRFQIARRIVIAEQQYITFHEFLPSMGVHLPTYTGYNPLVNATLGNEFATVGYRAHSQVHGEIEVETEASRYTDDQLAALRAQGIEVSTEDREIKLIVPLNVGAFNPDLVGSLQLGPLLQGIGAESEYRNDEQIDNQMRSILFQVPTSSNPDCLDGPELPRCYRGVTDLGAIDIERGRDHGMPSYNQLRRAYGLPAKSDFKSITGEASEDFPADPLLTPGDEINDPDSLDFVALTDREGNPIPVGSQEGATSGTRRTPLAARLKAVYGSVDQVDAFVGMVAEPHLPGAEFGELQRAIWTKQFQALRDGDRFFYGEDPALPLIKSLFGIDYRHTLAQVIAANTDIPLTDLHTNVFLLDSPLGQ